MNLTQWLARFIWGNLLMTLRRSPGRPKMRRRLRELKGPFWAAVRRSSKAQEQFAIRYGQRMIRWALNVLALVIMVTASYEIIMELIDHGWLTLNREELLQNPKSR